MRIFSALVVLAPLFCAAQDADSTAQKFFFENHIYKANIRTVQLHRLGSELSAPVVELNSSSQLQLSFDDLNADDEVYNYTFVHCNADWKPSDILEFDFISGFTEDRISDYRHSFNTYQRYTHYTLAFPNESMRLTKSGNYILKVFTNYDKNNVVITQRFMIAESLVTIEGNVHMAMSAEERRSKQELDFTIMYGGYEILNPFSDLKIFVLQNDRWDNAVSGLQPVFLRDKELVYDYENENLFNGGNEFRYLDFRSFKYHSERVDDITFSAPDTNSTDTLQEKKYHIWLLDDPRTSSQRYYSSKADLNGKFLITTQDVITESSATEADYAYIHFRLPCTVPPEGGSLYVGGALSNWTFSDENKLTYNPRRNAYEGALFLKQGYYNYDYFFVPDGNSRADETVISGSHSETENAYAIYVYHRSFGSRYDRIIGTRFLNSVSGSKY